MSLDEAIMFAEDSETKRRLTRALESGKTDRRGGRDTTASGGSPRSSRSSSSQNPELMYRAKGLLAQELERRVEISEVHIRKQTLAQCQRLNDRLLFRIIGTASMRLLST